MLSRVLFVLPPTGYVITFFQVKPICTYPCSTIFLLLRYIRTLYARHFCFPCENPYTLFSRLVTIRYKMQVDSRIPSLSAFRSRTLRLVSRFFCTSQIFTVELARYQVTRSSRNFPAQQARCFLAKYQ
jgi:hypothetical protein